MIATGKGTFPTCFKVSQGPSRHVGIIKRFHLKNKILEILAGVDGKLFLRHITALKNEIRDRLDIIKTT